MNLAQLQAQFYSDADDNAVPPAFALADVNLWLNEAQEEACMRKDLLHESQDPGLCTIDVTVGTSSYPTDAKLLRITYAAWIPEGSTDRTEIGLKLRHQVDKLLPGWRTASESTPPYLILEDTSLRLACIPTVAGQLVLEGTRLPWDDLENDDDEPEIAPAHHRFLVAWALYRAFGKPDHDFYDATKSGKALAEFERHFGLRPDADRLRDPEAEPTVNTAYW